MGRRSTVISIASCVAIGAASLTIATVSAPIAQAVAPTTAYAFIGTIPVANPSTIVVDPQDDTVYVGSHAAQNQLSTIAPGATSGAPLHTLALAGPAANLALDSDDDTVYVATAFQPQDIIVSPRGQSLAPSIPVGDSAMSIGVNSLDDTVYTTTMYYYQDDSFFAINGSNTDDSTQRRGVGGQVKLAVDDVANRIWAAGYGTETVRVVDGATLSVTSIAGTYPLVFSLAVSDATHEAFVGSVPSGGTPTLTKLNVNSGPIGSWTDALAANLLTGLSLDNSGSRAVFTTGYTGGTTQRLWILDTTTMQPEVPALEVTNFRSSAQAASGLIYWTKYDGGVQVMAKLQGALNTSAAQVGDTVTVTVTPTPAVAAGQPVLVDDTTLPTVSFGGFSAPATRTGANTFSVTVPSGPSGVVEAVATLAGGATMTLGNVTVGGGGGGGGVAPTPATAPRDPTASPGDAEATVSWTAPESHGSYPVTTYLAKASPGGQTCLTESLTCTVPDLANGTAYTFTVQALTGAGWSSSSEPSNAVVPSASTEPSILITGSRVMKRIEVSGTTFGFGVGAMLKPWVRLAGRSAYAQGAARVLVTMDGTFTWGRKTGKKASVYMQTPDGSLRSNAVTIR